MEELNNGEKDITTKLALIRQMVESAEDSIKAAKDVLNDLSGSGKRITMPARAMAAAAPGGFTSPVVGKIIEGVFDGQNMTGDDSNSYPVPANYASKSKLVQGDRLKLTIGDDGSFIYKQIAPVEREKLLGELVRDERGDYRVNVGNKPYRVILASITYFKGEPGDRVTLVLPKGIDAQWGAIENIIKPGAEVPPIINETPVGAMPTAVIDNAPAAPQQQVPADERAEEELNIE